MTTPLRVLYISNFSQPRCGIAEYGRQCALALKQAGAQVVEWDGTFSAITARENIYFPPNLADFDIVHINWHPVTINHYVPQHFPWEGKPLLSLMLHDLPPWSSCPVEGQAKVIFAAEPYNLLDIPTVQIPYPVVGYVPLPKAPPKETTIGYTGIRRDGFDELWELCNKRGWILNSNDPDVWLSIYQEIERLSHSTLNVCWHQAERGRASAPMTCLASRRPLLLSRSAMFHELLPYGDEIYCAQTKDEGELEKAVDRVLADISAGAARRPRIPSRVLSDFSWLRTAQRMIDAWDAAISAY